MRDSKFISRRSFVKFTGAAALGASVIKYGDDLLTVGEARADETPRPETPDEALKKLMAGNERFVNSLKKSPRRTVEVREQVALGQTPFAAILACADSRVAPEIIFDQGLGDLFVVRVAGNIVNTANYGIVGSLEYGALALGAHIIMVLGHSRCGAVSSAIEAVEKGTEFPGAIDDIVYSIGPAVAAAKDEPGDLLENATVANVNIGVDTLNGSVRVLADRVREGKLKIVGANYDIFTGEVKIVA